MLLFPSNHGSSPVRGKTVYSSPERPDWLFDSSSLLFNAYQEIFPRRRKAAGAYVDRLPPSSAKVIRERIHASTLLYTWLHAALRGHLQQFN